MWLLIYETRAGPAANPRTTMTRGVLTIAESRILKM